MTWGGGGGEGQVGSLGEGWKAGMGQICGEQLKSVTWAARLVLGN